MTAPLLWRWQMTPLEAFDGYVIHGRDATHLRAETRDFGTPMLPMPGRPGWSMQLAVSAASGSRDMRALATAQPELPRAAPGDPRSGLLLFDPTGTIVGGHVVRGTFGGEHLFLDPGYRRRGLARALVTEWHWFTQRPQIKQPQTLSPAAASVYLEAHLAVCRRAAAAGRCLPTKVWAELEDGRQTAIIRVLIDDARAGVKTRVRAGIAG